MTHAADPARFDHEGDTRVDLLTRRNAEEACDLVVLLHNALTRQAAESIETVFEIDRELVCDGDLDTARTELLREIGFAWNRAIEQPHLGRLKRISATGRDDS